MTKEEKTALGEKVYQMAFDYELNYGCCPQCVLTTVKETVGLVTDDVIKASHGLSGGGGLMGLGACGALTGGLISVAGVITRTTSRLSPCHLKRARWMRMKLMLMKSQIQKK